MRFHGTFAYVQAHLDDGIVQPLVRLRYGGSARHCCHLAVEDSGNVAVEDNIHYVNFWETGTD